MILEARCLRRPGAGRAFTLVELLVALAVFALVSVLLLQIVLFTGRAITADTGRLDAAAQVRQFFDRLGADLAARPRRVDLGGIWFQKNDDPNNHAGVNDAIQFYSQTAGYNAARQLSLVSYRVGNAPAGSGQLSGAVCLERAAEGTVWAGSQPQVLFLPLSAPTVSSTPTPAETNYDVLASGIFRLEFCLLLNTGSFRNTTIISVNSTVDYSSVTALVVAVAVLDTQSRRLLSDAQLTTVSGLLKDCPAGSTPMPSWNAALDDSAFAPGIPRTVLQNLRCYQRVFCLQ